MKLAAIILASLTLFGGSFVAFAQSGLGLGAEIYEVSNLDSPPNPLKRVAPIYPPDLKKERAMGVVNVEMIIDEARDVISLTVLTSAYPKFTKASLIALPEWKYEPSIKDGEPVKTLVQLPLSFTLRAKPGEKQVYPENPLRPRPEGVPLNTGSHEEK